MAQTPNVVGSRSGELSLMRQEIASLGSFELLDYLLKNPKQNSFPNLAFPLSRFLNGRRKQTGTDLDFLRISQ